jgi:archaellum component FlaC
VKTRLFAALLLAFAIGACTTPLTGPCKNIQTIDKSNLFDRLDPEDNPKTIKRDVENVQKQFVLLKKSAPTYLTSEVNKMSAAIDKIDALLASFDYDAKKLSTDAAAQAQLAQINKDAQPAAKQIDDYFLKNCKT